MAFVVSVLTLPDIIKIFFVYLHVGISSFGAATSEVLVGSIVEKKQWITIDRFSEIMAITNLLPGPFHVNLVIATGYSLHGIFGAATAVLAFVLPGLAVALLTVQFLQSVFAHAALPSGILHGALASIAGLVLSVLFKLGQKVLPSRTYWVLIAGISCLFFFFQIPFALAIVAGGLVFLLIPKTGVS